MDEQTFVNVELLSLLKSVTFARDRANFCQQNFVENFDRTSIQCKIVLKTTWLGEICKIFRDSVENWRENMNLRSKFCKNC